jgi:hypothetical protein
VLIDLKIWKMSYKYIKMINTYRLGILKTEAEQHGMPLDDYIYSLICGTPGMIKRVKSRNIGHTGDGVEKLMYSKDRSNFAGVTRIPIKYMIGIAKPLRSYYEDGITTSKFECADRLQVAGVGRMFAVREPWDDAEPEKFYLHIYDSNGYLIVSIRQGHDFRLDVDELNRVYNEWSVPSKERPRKRRRLV